MKKILFYILILYSSASYGQHFYAMDIEVESGREKEVKQLFDNYFEKYDTEGMSVLIFRNHIGNFEQLSSHSVVWIGSIDQINRGFNGEYRKGSDTTLFWKSLNEITEFKQDYTGDIVSADGDSTSDKNQDYQIVYGITPKSRTQFIKSWDKMMNKMNVKGSRHLIATPSLNRVYNSSVIGVNIGKDYKNTIDGLNKVWESKEWSEFVKESGGWQVNMSFSRKVIARYN